MTKWYILISMMCLGLFGQCRTNQVKKLGPVKSMEYRINDSWCIHPPVYFMLNHDEDGRYFLTNASNCEPEDARTMEVPASVAEQVAQIVAEENMLSYKRDYQPIFDVLDGHSWSIYINFDKSDKSVYSSGYMAYPSGDGLKRIEQLCQETWKTLIPQP